MLRVFKKNISPIHTYRDYDSNFSSKNDVLSPITISRLLDLKSPKTLTKNFYLTRSFGTRDKPRSALKGHSTVLDRQETGDTDEHETSFKKKNAEFNYHKKNIVLCKKSLYVFSEHNQLRKFAVWLTESLFFELITFSIIIFNAALLGTRDYIDPNSTKLANRILNYIEPVFISYYVFEGVMKIIARGFMNEPNSYLRSGWNWIDLFVIISSLIVSEKSLKYFSILRILRILDLLRPFKKFKSIDDMLVVIYNSSGTLLSILGLLLFFMLIFAILGLHW